MRVLVTGGRKYDDAGKVKEELDKLHEHAGIELLIHGGATGADSLADAWAKKNHVPISANPVTSEDWRRLGKKAGPLRNARMLLLEPDVVLAFPGGRGTADMKRQAIEMGVKVVEVKDQ